MTITYGRPETNATSRRMTLDEYLTYDDGTDARYELADGVLVTMGAENPLNPAIAVFLLITFFQMGVPYAQLAIGHQLGVKSSKATARQPDLIVHSAASQAAIFHDGRLLQADDPAPLLVVEVASSTNTDKQSRDRDYKEKRSEYAARSIPEYWIIDPDRAIVLVLTLAGKQYQEVSFTRNQAIVSPTFPHLNLTAEQILTAGQ
jgi:Uma2 family endonuclease